MKPTIRPIALLIVLILIATACNSLAPTATQTQAILPSETMSPSETIAPTATVTPEPSFTPTPALLPLEILEWREWPYTDLADPSNTDTHVEALIRNPNNVAVRINHDAAEFRFINAAGEVVYANPNPIFYLWQGEWMLPNETAALSVCVCFMSSGMEKKGWESLELFAPLEIATDINYTLDVDVKLGEIVDIAAAHLGGNGYALETTLTNTSDQALESVSHRVLAWDTDGRYVGVAFAGNAVVSFTKNLAIQPGDTATGLNVIEINYIDESKLPTLTYEAAAIGIPFQTGPTEAPVWPTGTSPSEWKGIPLLPDAIGSEVFDYYQYATQADFDQIVRFYETELTSRGFEIESTIDESAGVAKISFQRDDVSGEVGIAPVTVGVYAVTITISK